ncbi:MAG: OmpA family protein [Gammaproteobacteria bacterium]
MKFQQLALFLLLIGMGWSFAFAEEENFGKSTPSSERIIELFKSGADEDGAETGIRTRGLNIINKAKSTAAQRPITPAMEEKAISLEVLFDYDSDQLTAEAKQQLRPVGTALASEDLKGMHFRIEGHTDVTGSDQYNLDLSKRRAEAVKDYLTQQYGLRGVSLDIVGKGEYDLADKADPTSEVNRRVRIVRLGSR